MPSAPSMSRSRPAQNARPSPRTTTISGGSSTTAATARSMSWTQAMFIALSLSGRVSTISATSPSRRTTTTGSAITRPPSPVPAPLCSGHAPLVPSPISLAQFPFEHLADGVAGQRLDEVHRAWQLEAAKAGTTEGDELLGGGVHPLAQGDDRLHRLPPALVRDADQRGFQDRGVREQNPPDLAGVDVLPGGDDH